jgi:hypothetical protein
VALAVAPGRGNLSRQIARRVPLRQDLDREVRAIALTEAAADAIVGLDDRVVRQDEGFLGADLDADVAALAPFVDPADVDEIDDRGSAVRSPFGGIWSSRGCSPDSVEWPADEYGT